MLLPWICCDGAGSYRVHASYHNRVSCHDLECHPDRDSNTSAAHHYAVAYARFADGNLASNADAGIPTDRSTESYCQRNGDRDANPDIDVNANRDTNPDIDVNANRDTNREPDSVGNPDSYANGDF